jgi:C4-dicarboxylate transporter DctM subunit
VSSTAIAIACGAFLLPVLLTGLPIAFSILLVCLSYVLLSGADISLPVTTMFWFLNSSSLVAIPFFILAAEILSRSGGTDALVNASNAMFGKAPNGLALVTVVAIMVFSAICGSSVATAVAIGRVMIPKLIEDGYHHRFAVGLVAASGGLGILIPPSVPLIVYAAVVEISIGDLFLAAMGPGILLGLALCVFVVVRGDAARVRPSPGTEFFDTKGGRKRAILFGLPMFFFPVAILGGIYSGVFTPTEAAAVAVILAALMSFTIYRNSKLNDLFQLMGNAGTLSATILIIMAATSVLSYILSYERIPLLITQFITGLDVHPIVFLLAINVLLLVLGCFLEIISVILIVVPIILPSVLHLGIDPIHLGIIIIVNMELAVITPPVGMNLFVVSAISRQPVIEVFKGTLPFVALIAVCLLLLILFPELSKFTLDFFKP